MNWIAVFLGLLPQVAAAVVSIKGDLSHNDKKSLIKDSVAALASGVATVLPAHAAAAQTAASVASSAVDGVYDVIAQVSGTPAPAVAK